MEISDPGVLSRAKSVKAKIEKMIGEGYLKDAQEALDSYEKMITGDIDICSMRAVILIMENKLDEAEAMLLKGLKNDSCIFDLLFNLAYIYELRGKYQQAADLYLKAGTVAITDDNNTNIKNALENLKTLNNNIEIIIKKKIVFLVKRGMDNFIGDIINGLSDEYWIRKIIVDNYHQIDEGMKWADICWFEWCDELVGYGSKHKLAYEKQIICRLHSYEAFTNYPMNVNWDNVDSLIFVAEHIKDNVLGKINIPEDKVNVIYNGINLDRYTFKKRERGFNIAYLGWINYKKGPMLLIHTFKAIYDTDNRYKLYIAGEYQEERYKLYFNQMIKELGLEDNVIFDGWQNDVNTWLDDKHYILSTSVLEGNPVGIMEGMARGIKPLIHNFVGARKQFGKYVWNSIPECVEMVMSEEFEPEEYRSFILNTYSSNEQISRIINIIKNLTPKSIKEEDVIKYYNNFLGHLKYDRKRENPRHIYLKNRLMDVIKSGDEVLDLGCGIGITTEFISTLGVKSVLGVDLSPELIDYAKKTVPGIDFISHDITTIKLGKKYDVISLCDVMEHIPEARYGDLFNVLSSHLKENGMIFISVPDPDYLDGARNTSPETLQIIDNSITYEQMQGYCTDKGLKIFSFKKYGIFAVSEYNEYVLCWA